MAKFFCKRVLFWGLLWVVSCGFADNHNVVKPISGRDPYKSGHIIPADVLARVQLISQQVSAIRKAIGRPPAKLLPVSVSGAAPREVYFGALALFHKTNQLAYEVTRGFEPVPNTIPTDLRPQLVWLLVNRAYERLRRVIYALGIRTTFKEQPQPTNATPSDVLNAILQVNQCVNNLLQTKIKPSDAFQQVTLAINYAHDLLRSFNTYQQMPTEPALESNLMPRDVYKRLLDCLGLLKQISKKSGVEMLVVHIDKNALGDVLPGNVFDLAKILMSELYYYDYLRTGEVEFEVTYDPGYKTPSQVYQRAGVLLQQIKQLQAYVDKQPNWLKSKK